MRIMQVIQDLRVGGAERTAVTLCNGLAKRGHEVMLVAVQAGGAQEALLSRHDGVRLEILGIVRRSIANPVAFVGDSIRLDVALRRWLRDFRPEIIQTHLPEESMLVDHSLQRMTSGQHVPVVHSQRFHVGFCTDRQEFDLRSRFRLHLFDRAMKRAARVVAVSAAVKSLVVQLTKIDPGVVEVVHNGTDLETFHRLAPPAQSKSRLGLPPDRRIVIAVGRLDRAKNYPLLVQASASMLQRLPDTVFVLAGEGPERARIEAQIRELGVERSWVLLGQRMDIPDCLAAADLFAMSSEWEGFPVAIIEAMAAGLPIVATDVAGVAEVIEHEVNGLLVEKGEAGQLCDALSRLAADPDLAKRLGGEARRLAMSEYDLESYVDRMEALLLQVVSTT